VSDTPRRLRRRRLFLQSGQAVLLRGAASLALFASLFAAAAERRQALSPSRPLERAGLFRTLESASTADSDDDAQLDRAEIVADRPCRVSQELAIACVGLETKIQVAPPEVSG